MEHTPGPWEVTGRNRLYISPISLQCQDNESGSSGSDIGKGSQIYTKRTIKEAQANARLIASAPDLLEACQYVVNYHREHDSGEGELFGLDFVTTCINAIRRATGD